MNTLDCTIKLSDVRQLCDVISRKILGHSVVREYLGEEGESFYVNSERELLVEWSIRDWVDEKGRECCETDYITFAKLLEELEEKDFITVSEYLVRSCERVFYDAYHEHSSDAFPLKFMMDKIRRLGL